MGCDRFGTQNGSQNLPCSHLFLPRSIRLGLRVSSASLGATCGPKRSQTKCLSVVHRFRIGFHLFWSIWDAFKEIRKWLWRNSAPKCWSGTSVRYRSFRHAHIWPIPPAHAIQELFKWLLHASIPSIQPAHASSGTGTTFGFFRHHLFWRFVGAL